MVKIPKSVVNPPDIFAWLERCFTSTAESPFPRIDDISTLVSEQIKQHPQTTGYESCKQTRLLILFFSIAFSAGTMYCGEHLVSCMATEGFTLAQLNSLPFGISIPLLQVIRMCKDNPPDSWGEAEFSLIGRKDLTFMANVKTQVKKGGVVDAVAEPENYDTVFFLVFIWIDFATREYQGIDQRYARE
jgi:hypothetical protein